MVESRGDLAGLVCIPCRGDTPPIPQDRIAKMLNLVPGWTLKKGPDQIERLYEFKDFKRAMVFVNKVADIAESQDHHPDILIHWNEVTLTLWTHAINGLFDNDFIVAAKIDEVIKSDH